VGQFPFDQRSAVEQDLDSWVSLNTPGALAVRLVGADRDAPPTSPADAPVVERAEAANGSGKRNALEMTNPDPVRNHRHLTGRTADGAGLEVDAERVFGEVRTIVDGRHLGDDFDSLLGQRLAQRPAAIGLIAHDPGGARPDACCWAKSSGNSAPSPAEAGLTATAVTSSVLGSVVMCCLYPDHLRAALFRP
jgi:hypothetical protein